MLPFFQLVVIALPSYGKNSFIVWVPGPGVQFPGAADGLEMLHLSLHCVSYF